MALDFTIASDAKAAFKHKGLKEQMKQRCLGKTTQGQPRCR